MIATKSRLLAMATLESKVEQMRLGVLYHNKSRFRLDRAVLMAMRLFHKAGTFEILSRSSAGLTRLKSTKN